MSTHVQAREGEVAHVVLLPGNPDRAEYIAQRFLREPRCYTKYRRLLGYTGMFRGVPISVQTTGMGGPSAAIVCEELSQLGARVFIRVGTCGTLRSDISLGDIIIATGACSVGGPVEQLVGVRGYAPVADHVLVCSALEAAEAAHVPAHAGLVASMDLFYDDRPEIGDRLARYGVLALEMEAATVFTLGARPGHRAACLLAVSDLIASQTRATPEAIKRSIDKMTEIALATALEAATDEG